MDADLRKLERRASPGPLRARPASADADYFQRRTMQEHLAALGSRDVRVRRVHLELALRYGALTREAKMLRWAGLRRGSS